MTKPTFKFADRSVELLFDGTFDDISGYCSPGKTVVISDTNIYNLHREKLDRFKVILIPPGEQNKNQKTVDYLIEELIKHECDKQSIILGVGGGVVTDLAGYVASIFKRGVRLGLVPTSVLSMVDAAIGGKNGINAGIYKNMIGTIYQPEFILYDYSFLNTLPVKEWVNGFAEIIKHACIKDVLLFNMLEKYTLHEIQMDKTLIASLIEQNARIKLQIVIEDEFEKADRKLLNFGHTFGHAIENLHQMPHGQAISIGMVAACNLSEKISGLPFENAQRIVKLLAKYHLPVDIETDYNRVFEVLKLDKKRENNFMHFVLLTKIGHAETRPVPLDFLNEHIKQIL